MSTMGVMLVVFVAALTFAAHHFNHAFVRGLRLNLDLSERTEELTQRTEELTQRTEELTQRTEVAPFQWTVCQLAVYVLVMAACMSAS